MGNQVKGVAPFGWMRIGQAVEYTGLPMAVIVDLLAKGAVRHYKTGEAKCCCSFVKLQDIEEWMDANSTRVQ